MLGTKQQGKVLLGPGKLCFQVLAASACVPFICERVSPVTRARTVEMVPLCVWVKVFVSPTSMLNSEKVWKRFAPLRTPQESGMTTSAANAAVVAISS